MHSTEFLRCTYRLLHRLRPSQAPIHALRFFMSIVVALGILGGGNMVVAKTVTTELSREVSLDNFRDAGASTDLMESAFTRDNIITWFGYMDEDGNAVEGETWTFDHGNPDPFEGWGGFYPQNLTAWRQIDASSWTGHGNPDPPPIITGTGCVWAGIFEDEAIAEGWAGGIGYGNDWCYRFQSPVFSWNETLSITLSFNYWLDLEEDYDFLRIYLRGVTMGNEILLEEMTGIIGDMQNPQTSYTAIGSYVFGEIGEVDARIVFEVSSDGSFSDEDGDYNTSYGPFTIDDIELTGGVVGGDILYTYDTGAEGFSTMHCESGISFSGIAPSENYPIPCDPSPLSGNILHLHDENEEHPDGQFTAMVSPPVMAPEGANQFLAEVGVFAELPYGGIFYRLGWRYTVDGLEWSDRVGSSGWNYTEGAICGIRRTSSLGYVPENATAVRFVIELFSSCESFGIPPQDCQIPGNFSPLFDNIRIGVLDPAILVFPSIEYWTIQMAINASTPSRNNVLVWPGVYQQGMDLSILNHDLHIFSGSGAETTILEGTGTAINVQGDHGNAFARIEGFTFRGWENGLKHWSSSARHLLLEANIFHDCETGVYMSPYNDPEFYCEISMSNCLIHGNDRGVFISGYPVVNITGCTIAHNTNYGIEVDDTNNSEYLDIDIFNSIIWGNGAQDLMITSDPYLDIHSSAVDIIKIVDPEDSIEWGNPNENIYIDPFFCNPAEPGRTTEGTYTLDAVSPCLPAYSPSGNLIGTRDTDCTTGIVIPTPPGSEIEVILDNATLTFETVSDAGVCRLLTREDGPTVDPQFLLAPADPPCFYYLTTTAEYSGDITICIEYNEEDLTLPESSLTLLHFDTHLTPPAWVDIISEINTEENTICGICQTLSPFVLVEDAGTSSVETRDIDEGRTGPLITYQNHPNPAEGSTMIRYDLPVTTVVTAKVFNVAGQLVRVLTDHEPQEAGPHQCHWDGRDLHGNRVESGCYFYQVKTGESMQTRQMLLVK